MALEDVEGMRRAIFKFVDDNRDSAVSLLCECACVLHGDGFRDLALEYLASACDVGGGPRATARAHLLLGAVLEKANDLQTAAIMYGSVMDLPERELFDWYFLHNNLGYCLAETGRFAEAVPHCLAAIRIDPTRHNAFMNLGIAFRGLGRFEEAAGCFRHAYNAYPEDQRARRHLASLLCDGRLEDIPDLEARRRCNDRARGHFQKLIRDGGATHGSDWVPLADFDGMCRALTEHFDEDTGSLCYALGMLAWLLVARGESFDILRAAEHIVASGKPVAAADALISCAENLTLIGRTSEALTLFAKAEKLLPAVDDFLLLHYHSCLGDCLTDLGRHAEAEPHHREFLRLDPWLDAVHRRLGIALLALGRPGEAEVEILAADALTTAPARRLSPGQNSRPPDDDAGTIRRRTGGGNHLIE